MKWRDYKNLTDEEKREMRRQTAKVMGEILKQEELTKELEKQSNPDQDTEEESPKSEE